MQVFCNIFVEFLFLVGLDFMPNLNEEEDKYEMQEQGKKRVP